MVDIMERLGGPPIDITFQLRWISLTIHLPGNRTKYVKDRRCIPLP